MAKMIRNDENWFEVTSDVLFIDGRTLRRGDVIQSSEISERLAKMLKIGMILTVSVQKRAA